MGIERTPDGGFVATGKGIDAVRLMSLRGMLRLEKLGMKTRAGALRPKMAKELGLSPRASFDVYLAEVEKRIEALKPQVQAENEAGSGATLAATLQKAMAK
jgi:hypothetical protein